MSIAYDSTTNSEVIANSFKFNDFFVYVGKNLAENIKSDIDPLKYITNNVHSIKTIEITDDKILNTISTMKIPRLVLMSYQLL